MRVPLAGLEKASFLSQRMLALRQKITNPYKETS
jgi:hypothetical protein